MGRNLTKTATMHFKTMVRSDVPQGRNGKHRQIVATILKDLGLVQEARPLAERALAIAEATYGPDHPTVAIRLSVLAGILRDLGLVAEARPLAERALAIDEAALGPDHPTVATLLNVLASILGDLGLAEEARPLAERAAAITEAARQAKA